jgi:hypothetical protein
MPHPPGTAELVTAEFQYCDEGRPGFTLGWRLRRRFANSATGMLEAYQGTNTNTSVTYLAPAKAANYRTPRGSTMRTPRLIQQPDRHAYIRQNMGYDSRGLLPGNAAAQQDGNATNCNS